MDKDIYDKFNLSKMLLDHVKFYINPEIYKAEKDAEKGIMTYDRRNALFEQQSAMGHATGEMRSPRIMREAIREFYKDEENHEEIEQTFVTVDGQGNVVNTRQVEKEDEFLG